MARDKTIDELYDDYLEMTAQHEDTYRAAQEKERKVLASLRTKHAAELEPVREVLKRAIFRTCMYEIGEDFIMYAADDPQRWRVVGIRVQFPHSYHDKTPYWEVRAKRVRKDGATYGDIKEFSQYTMMRGAGAAPIETKET